jgi:hypothetical protein
MSKTIAFRMKGYVIVASKSANSILLSTFSSSRAEAWRKLLEKNPTKSREFYKREGFKSVGVEILTERFFPAKK